MDERFCRDKSDITENRSRTEKLEELSIKMSQILERMDEKLDDHSARLKALENRRTDLFGKWETAVIGTLVGMVFSGIFSLILG